MLHLKDLFSQLILKNFSDLHISVGLPPFGRVNGRLSPLPYSIINPEDSRRMAREVLNNEELLKLEEEGDVETSLTLPGGYRCRLNAYRQRDEISLALRVLNLQLPGFDELGLPAVMEEICGLKKGLVLVTGSTGMGKTTTISAMLNWMNKNRAAHIITLEDPIEYIHKPHKCIINQREIGKDTPAFNRGLRYALRQDPDIIFIGEMRDLESISIALTAAETGHLVLSTLHTSGAANTIDRIVDVFPPHQQLQILVQLSQVLQGIISQQLLPGEDEDSRVLATEVLIATPAVRNLIRERRIHQIDNAIVTGAKFGMKTMDSSIYELLLAGKISYEDALAHAYNVAQLKSLIKGKSTALGV